MSVRAVIDLSALRHNLSQVRRLAPESAVMAVIKSDGYGHGATRVADALSSADALAVARPDEALALRAAGIRNRIVVLGGVTEPAEWDAVIAADLEPVVHARWQLDSLAACHLRPSKVWVKLDSGMHRLGLPLDDAAGVRNRLMELDVSIAGWMTHLARADEVDRPETAAQIAAFTAHTADFSEAHSIGNSAGLIHWPDARSAWVRPGIMLYGVSPMLGCVAADHGLRPVMTLESQIVSVREVAAGEPVGYGGRWVAPRPTRIAVVAVGYGDGYPRHAHDGAPVLVNGVAAQLAGRVSMDMTTVDVSSVPDAAVGDPVTLWGQGLPVERVAAAAETIGYELLCHVTSRVERCYRR